jgi:hypothetical protein
MRPILKLIRLLAQDIESKLHDNFVHTTFARIGSRLRASLRAPKKACCVSISSACF